MNYSALLFIEFHPIDYKPFLQFSKSFFEILTCTSLLLPQIIVHVFNFMIAF